MIKDLDKFSKIDECIEFHCKKDPEADCFSLRVKGSWKNFKRKDFWKEVEHYSSIFSEFLNESSLILFIKKQDFSLLSAYIGAIKAGHFPAQISHLSSKVSETEYLRKINHIIEITGARGIFTDNDEVKNIPLKENLKIFTPETEYKGKNNFQTLPSEIALVQFSSGSTGLQKGVKLSHKAIIEHMKNYSAAINLSPSDIIISWLPLYHDMGLIACYLMPLMYGIPFSQIEPFDWILSPDIFLQAIEEKKATICFLPNFAYHIFINKGKKHDLSSMRLFINCSEPARTETHSLFLKKFPDVKPESLTVCYALAENTFAVSQFLKGKEYTDISVSGKSVISCGNVITGTQVKIFDKDKDGVGEVGIRGDYLFSSFMDGNLPLRESYYLTGDLGILTDENELFIVGRKKDIIIVNGKNIYPQDIEHAVSNVPGVYPGRVVAFGIINNIIGSEELFVIAERDKSVDNTSLKLSIQKIIELEVGLQAKKVEIIEHMTLVKTSSGKISRSRNKDLYQSGELKVL